MVPLTEGSASGGRPLGRMKAVLFDSIPMTVRDVLMPLAMAKGSPPNRRYRECAVRVANEIGEQRGGGGVG